MWTAGRGDCLVRLLPLSAEHVAILEDVVRDEQIPCKRFVIEVISVPLKSGQVKY